MKRWFLPLVALLIHASGALAQTRALPPGEIRANGDITFGNTLKLGRRDAGKTILTPEALQILGPGSSGDVSGMSVMPPSAARGGVVARALADIASDTITPLAYGAVCDGTARALSSRYATLAQAQAVYGSSLVTALTQDLDTVAWQAALNTGRVVSFPAGRTCTLRARLSAAVTGGITGDYTGAFIANATDFPGTVLADGGAATTLIRSDQGIGVVIRGFGFRFTPSQNSFTRAVVVTRAAGVVVEGLDLSGFNAGNMIEIDSSTDVRVQNNLIRDSLLDRIGSTSQLTAIAIDDNLVGGVPSRRVRIADNKIRNLLVTPAFRASYDYQSDGITVLPSAIDVTVSGNAISGVGEGIDFQANGGSIVGNTVSTAYQFGIKLIHGASNNTVMGNAVTCPGLGGITANGGSAKASVGNTFIGNAVSGPNCLGEYDQNTTWAYGAQDVGLGFPATANTFIGNTATAGSKATTAYLWFGAGTGNSATLAQISADYPRQTLAPGGTPMIASLTGINGTVATTKASDPTTADIPAGQCADWNNTAAGTFRRVCNFGGTLRSATMN